jgi:predicted naringenin-chalcone synthase
MNTCHVGAIATAFPPFSLSTPGFMKLAVAQRSRRGLSISANLLRHVEPLLSISNRFSLHPGLDGCEDAEVTIDGTTYENLFRAHDYAPPLYARMSYWAKHVPHLAEKAARRALARWGGDPERITHVVTTTTSGWVEPGIATHLIHALGLTATCEKQELLFNGCFCGMTALRVGRDLVRCEPDRVCLVVAVESSSSHFSFTSTDPSSVISNALFADGASAVVLEQRGGWAVEAAGMINLPDTASHMTWRQPASAAEQNYIIHLDRGVPDVLEAALSSALGDRIFDRFAAGGAKEALGFAIHPGGRRILDAVRGVLVRKGFDGDKLAASYEALDQTGNIATVSVGVVLEKVLAHEGLEKILALAFGPGMTLEWSILGRR